MLNSTIERRYHVPLVVAIYLLGFYAPWQRYWNIGSMESAWLSAASLLARLGIPLISAVQTVTVAALLFAFLGTTLRVWGTATQLASPDTTRPYPLYLGSWLFHMAVIILMPQTGALFAILAHGILTWRLMHGDTGDGMLQSSPPGVNAWLKALLLESYFFGYLICFAVFAWRYNAFLLTRCAILCFGAWLILRAIFNPR